MWATLTYLQHLPFVNVDRSIQPWLVCLVPEAAVGSQSGPNSKKPLNLDSEDARLRQLALEVRACLPVGLIFLSSSDRLEFALMRWPCSIFGVIVSSA